jgi:hypothetical protein
MPADTHSLSHDFRHSLDPTLLQIDTLGGIRTEHSWTKESNAVANHLLAIGARELDGGAGAIAGEEAEGKPYRFLLILKEVAAIAYRSRVRART